MKDGLLLVDKHGGCTSHDIVQQVRRLLGQKKTGHCGTLDPSATGLLLLTLGRATRLTRFLIQAPKVYEGTIRLGIETDTYDAAGEVAATKPTEGITFEAVSEAMTQFEGVIEQQAPRYSAKKIKGQKFYELARRGEEVPVEIKAVTVYEFSPQGGLEEDRIRFRLGCTSGTYARSLAHDLGQALGCGGHLESLRRLQIGDFKVDTAKTLEALEELAETQETKGSDLSWIGSSWIPFDAIPLPFQDLVVDPVQEERIQHGQTVLVQDLRAEEGDWIKLVNRRRVFVAVGTVTERIGSRGVAVIQPRVVFT
ncbi:MAG: tRNA pseudouridine(55) synthase TruB [Deltaproteobacteria bacterium]|nr:tRNA pseudouridine(55) synthase TruB [Deltaproteobacteria bacterium]